MSAASSTARRLAIVAGRRLAWGVAVLALVSIGTFLLAEAAPGDYYAALRLDPRISEAAIATWSARHGLDRPLPVRYARWLGSVARGELGWSLSHQAPVGPLLADRAARTLVLTATATALAWLVALPWGAWAAVRPRRWADRVGEGTSALLLAVPELVVALAFLLWAAANDWPVLGGADLRHLPLPAVALAAVALPQVLRHVRSAVAGALAEPWAAAARAHGIGGARLLRGALRAAAPPLVTLLGLSLGGLLSGSFVIEIVLGWPGMGPLLYEAILARDLHVVVAAILLAAALLLAGNLVADLLLVIADPRVRDETAS